MMPDLFKFALLLTLMCQFLLGCDRTQTPDFKAIENVAEKKQQFFSFLRPLVEVRNAQILRDRERLLALHDKAQQTDLNWFERNQLEDLMLRYNVVAEQSNDEVWDTLLRRVDIVPVDLALIQAAKESGWGTSRFAQLGNNFYGERCFRSGCGIVPKGRPGGAVFEVTKYESAADSVRSYINNLNTHVSYLEFRVMRRDFRRQGKVPEAMALVSALGQYSERREDYLYDILQMMRANSGLIASLEADTGEG